MYNSHNCNVRIVQPDLYEEDAYQLEYETVKWYREHTKYRLTNQTDGGDGTRGFMLSDEQIAHISEASKRQWQNEEWKEAVIAKRHLPTSTYQSKAFKEKISSLVSREKNPNYGNYWSDEQKNALSKKQISSGRYIGSKNPNSKKIQCVETGETFDCISSAMEKYGVRYPASFSVALNNPTRTAASLHWTTI